MTSELTLQEDLAPDGASTRTALRESERRYRSLFENMLVGCAYHRMLYENGEASDYIYLEVNPAFEQLTGLTGAAGKKVSEVIPGIARSDPALLARYGRVARTGKGERFESYVESLGQWFAISVYSPEPDHFVTVFDNITERKRVDAELKQLTQNLEQRVVEATAQLQRRGTELELSNRELEAFGYSLAHDLRGPLRAIDGFASMLSQRYTALLDEEGNRLLGKVRDEAKRLDRLLEDLLAFSRAGPQDLHRSEVDMTALVEAAFALCTAQLADRKVSFVLHPLPVAFGEPVMLRQVVHNLLDNALKFTRPRPVAEIEVGTLPPRPDGAELVFYVRDNGVGFDDRYVHKLFGVFQRLHTESAFEGNGIGLALIQRIVRRHGGRVWAEGALDRGATFFFSLPAGTP